MSLRSLLRRLVRRLPPVASRDRRIAALQTRLAERSEGWAQNPSFQGRVFALRRIRKHEAELGVRVPSVISRGKFWVYDFVRSHGMEIPEQFGRWDDAADIPWLELPDRVVIKSARGSTSRGVFPLQRVDDGWHLATHQHPMSQEMLLDTIAARLADRSIRGPFVAEEFLEPRVPDGLPLEIKVYAFYGEVPVVVLSESRDHGRMSAVSYRVVDPTGSNLVDETTNPALAGATGRSTDAAPSQIDLTLPVPKRLDEVIDIASRLTIAMRLPFARIDLYDVPGRLVFGEVTPRPGGRQWFGTDLDVLMGTAWERAEARLTRDLSRGAPPEPQRGLG
ncbi:ATP-grasp fold amidoligase family protein [Aeromicrobium sp.]|uniref:ATP-grasp fold amidoligase family protein n=1 Tax=Aeromicrobium sp. TaxID=1871063 RepID=UPI003C45CDA6